MASSHPQPISSGIHDLGMGIAYRKDAVKSAIVILPSGEKEEGKRESSSQTKGENEKRRLSKAKDEDKVIKKSRSVQEQGK